MYIYYSLSLGVGLLSLIVFFILRWLEIPAGSLADWLIGIAIFYWLLTIVTIPWNVYFESKEVIAEADVSDSKGIPVDMKQISYVQKVAKWAIFIAIALHLISAVVLYLLAFFEISVIGYISSIAALLLTFLRPAIRTYQYLANRLSTIRQQIKYPREDVVELRTRVKSLEVKVNNLEKELNFENNKSFASLQQKQISELKEKIEELTNYYRDLSTNNNLEHKQILQQSQNALAQLTEDSQFLGNVREIIRFFKNVS